ncbi:MAG TPA: delta-60 repeat domain-containing protein, partial [Pyrinomonadaceae bacterium]|nr:delta-60 repeat domain-containing protein [Pyrinomonadaceae bacterium]
SFGDHGKVTTDVGDGKASSLAVQDNKIIVAGSAYDGDNNEFAVVRYKASGKLDMSFNAAGSVLTAVGSKPSESEDTTPRVSMAVINDPDGYTNVRDYDGKVIAKVKAGERFVAAKPWNRSDDPRWSVCLKSGITGFIDKTRIHLLPDEPLMKLNHDASKKEWRKFQSARDADQGETASAAKGRGLDYYKVLMAASNGDKKALAQFFSLAEFMDGAAAEGYFPDASAVFHLVGDKTFSNFVRGLPVADQVGVRGTVMGGLSEEEFANRADVTYLQRYFPETTKLLFRGEIVDWTSPDGRYSIRKTFTDPLDLAESKVSHAEPIEKATGQTLCDLTNADIGVGGDREGSVLWSPDSKRFAYVASDLSHAGRLFRKAAAPPQKTQTTVYQNSDKSFTKIDLPFDQPPGKENDPEIKGAVMGHEFVTPVRWADANTLILERHDYYERLMPPAGSVHGFDRLYEITVSFKDDGTANTSWKLREDR